MTLAVGQTWNGNTLNTTTYPIQLMQAPDGHGPRAKQVSGGIELTAYDTDLASNPNPRCQLQSPGLLVVGGSYKATFTIDVGQSFPALREWCAFWQVWGAPYTGSPQLQIQTNDGVKWGPRQANGQWLAQVPLDRTKPHAWEFDFKWSTNGNLSVKYDGASVVHDATFADITSADNKGPWSIEPHVYYQRGAAAVIGPITYSNIFVTRTA